MTFKSLLAIAVALVLIVSWTVIRDKEALPAFDKAEEMIMMRDIGHKVLLHAGDSSSRVLPVQEIAGHEYILQFQSRFTFIPDSLVRVVDRAIRAHHLPLSYMVQVIACNSDQVIFGYSMHQDSTNNIVPCIGREQEKACYKIRLLFPATNTANTSYLLPASLLAIGLSLLARFLYNKRRKTARAAAATPNEPVPATDIEPSPATQAVNIGRYLFYRDKQLLQLDEQTIALTAKEAKLLQVFAAAPNEVIDRNRLLKEVWEDEGVIVGRSLDMFVSKLRKKLQQDPGISIINVHGKGYKLAINA
ncbi:winged helix-turn-helix transcriptional regulator [Pseudoflavitalea sp. X16]|uniref:winged helix-turn-helix domain-containing protein n=1 Tax=Paraflavitalea devenefica TaxID=2716334 RepID=UPI0014206C35|nr:winged helix-turn-helix domain-containing protein [Paraflavitalea devenefica]NII29212.1 winged helix-turn-helix transcriptional regulator [Paraflavitalea devenefica]